MSAWHATFTDLMRSRFPALVAYGTVLTGDRVRGRDLAEQASVAVFSGRKTPRTMGAAERSAREWMARTHAAMDPVRAAAVLRAIDGLDDDGVRRVLGKAAEPVEVSPADAAALREQYLAQAAVYVSPTAGVNNVMAPARRSHQAALARAGVLGAVGAVAVAALAYGAVSWLPGAIAATGTTTSASPSPSSSLVAVTWNGAPEVATALAAFHWPECGDKFSPAAQAVGNVLPVPDYQGADSDPTFGDYYMFGTGFEAQDGKARTVLGVGNGLVITLDDVVVYAQEPDARNLGVYATGVPAPAAMFIDRASMCDGQAAMDKEFGDVDWETLTDEEQQELSDRQMEFQKGLGDFEPGTYKVYALSPIVFGEQAALAQQLIIDGLNDFTGVAYNIAYTSLAEDPRIAPFCTGDPQEEFDEVTCDVPPDVLAEVLTRELDPAAIVDVAPGMGISEPLELEVEAGGH